MKLRDHDPIIINEFMGLYKRGSALNTPLDHFQDCENVKFTSGGDVKTRDGVNISQSVLVPLSNIKRIYNYPTQTANTLIVLTYDYDTNIGSIYHVVNAATVYGPLLSITGMTDFAFLPYNGRGYISPFASFQDTNGLNIEKGLQNEFLYVYLGDGTVARKAGISPLTTPFTIANGVAGHTDPGIHLFGFVVESDSGALSSISSLSVTGFTTAALSSVSFTAVPLSASASATKRHLVATKVIVGYNGDPLGYQFFFVPNATINDNVTTTLSNISFYDADLLEDASYLIDNYSDIPAGAVLTLYRNRLVLTTTYTDISLALVSAAGEPESISQVDGLIIYPLDGNPITNASELRDVLYLFKRSSTVSYTDNDDVPSSWSLVPVDTALGTCVHGIATVLDSGNHSVDYLIIATYQGITLFNGRFNTPELSWKIEDLWTALERNNFRLIQILNAPIQKEIYIVLPDNTLLVGNYSLGMDPKRIKWSPWSFDAVISTVAIVNIDTVILGADL